MSAHLFDPAHERAASVRQFAGMGLTFLGSVVAWAVVIGVILLILHRAGWIA